MSKLTKYLVTIFGVLIIGGAIYYGTTQTRKSPIQPASNEKTGQASTPSDSPSINNSADTITANNRIIIQKIDVSAPIIDNVDGNNMQTYMNALENGVAHLKKTSLPGDPGNTVIFGHSSYFKNKPGNYKTIFAKLNNLTIGATIQIKHQNKDLAYKVFEKKIVRPEDVSVVSQDNTKRNLTLITCWPIGTTKERLVILASLN